MARSPLIPPPGRVSLGGLAYENRRGIDPELFIDTAILCMLAGGQPYAILGQGLMPLTDYMDSLALRGGPGAGRDWKLTHARSEILLDRGQVAELYARLGLRPLSGSEMRALVGPRKPRWGRSRAPEIQDAYLHKLTDLERTYIGHPLRNAIRRALHPELAHLSDNDLARKPPGGLSDDTIDRALAGIRSQPL
jgi:hypothetical protein